MINPQPITTFQQKIKDKKESVYLSNQRAPLGKSHDQRPGLPKGLDVLHTTFGTAVVRGNKKKNGGKLNDKMSLLKKKKERKRILRKWN